MKSETREYGSCLLRIVTRTDSITRYTLVSERRTLLDMLISDDGFRVSIPIPKKGAA